MEFIMNLPLEYQGFVIQSPAVCPYVHPYVRDS